MRLWRIASFFVSITERKAFDEAANSAAAKVVKNRAGRAVRTRFSTSLPAAKVGLYLLEPHDTVSWSAELHLAGVHVM